MNMFCLAHPGEWYDLIIIILSILLSYSLHWVKRVRIVGTTQLIRMLSFLWVESKACHKVHVVQRNSSYNLLQLIVSPKALVLRAYKPETKGNVRPKGKIINVVRLSLNINPSQIYLLCFWYSSSLIKYRKTKNNTEQQYSSTSHSGVLWGVWWPLNYILNHGQAVNGLNLENNKAQVINSSLIFVMYTVWAKVNVTIYYALWMIY